VCDRTPLWKLVAVLNEAYGSDIRISRPALRSLPLTATFQDESLEAILDVISQTFDIRVERDGSTIVLH
ncbi:MAG TPA: DUF4974 domain-containing protein, partial [Chitinophagaceae bacterium]|nr:DUF4974 domain-containing protein [Chitinophagaceae bacterium]